VQDLPDEELVRAKNFFKGTYVSSLESRVRSCSDMAFSALMDSVTDPVEWLEAVDNVSGEDVQNLLRFILRSKPTCYIMCPEVIFNSL